MHQPTQPHTLATAATPAHPTPRLTTTHSEALTNPQTSYSLFPPPRLSSPSCRAASDCIRHPSDTCRVTYALIPHNHSDTTGRCVCLVPASHTNIQTPQGQACACPAPSPHAAASRLALCVHHGHELLDVSGGDQQVTALSTRRLGTQERPELVLEVLVSRHHVCLLCR